MNKRNVLMMALALLSLSQAGLVAAGNRPEAWTVSLNGSYFNFDDKRHLDNIFLPNFGIAYNFNCRWAVEANVGIINTRINPPKVPQSTGVHGGLYTVDGIYRLGQMRGFIEPYILAGVGVMSLDPNGVDSKHQGNVNAGIGTQLFVTPSIGFRFEGRDVYTMSGGKNDYQLTGGLSFLFDSHPCCV